MKNRGLPQCPTSHCHKSSSYLFNTLLKIYTNYLCKCTYSSKIYTEVPILSKSQKPLIFWKCCCGFSPSTILAISKKIHIHIIFGSLAAKVPLTLTRATFSPASSHLNRPWHALFFLSYSLLSLLIWKVCIQITKGVRQQLPIDCQITHNRALQVRVMAVCSSKLSCFSLVCIPPFKYQSGRLPSDGLVGIAKRIEYSVFTVRFQSWCVRFPTE